MAIGIRMRIKIEGMSGGAKDFFGMEKGGISVADWVSESGSLVRRRRS